MMPAGEEMSDLIEAEGYKGKPPDERTGFNSSKKLA
jgi:hypothetical protein